MGNEEANKPSPGGTDGGKVDWSEKGRLAAVLRLKPAETLDALLSEPKAVGFLGNALAGYGNETFKTPELRRIVNSISAGEGDPRLTLLRTALEDQAITGTQLSVVGPFISVIGILILSFGTPRDLRWLVCAGFLLAFFPLMFGVIFQVEAHRLWWRRKRLFGRTACGPWSRRLLFASIGQPILIAAAIAGGIHYNTYYRALLTTYKTDGVSFRYPKSWLPPLNKVVSKDYTTPRILKWASSANSETIHVLKRERERYTAMNMELLLWVCRGAGCDFQLVRSPRGNDSLESRFEDKRRLSEKMQTKPLRLMGEQFVSFSVDRCDLPSGYPALIERGQKADGETAVSYEFLSGQFAYAMIFVYDYAGAAEKGAATRDRIVQTLTITVPALSPTTGDLNEHRAHKTP